MQIAFGRPKMYAKEPVPIPRQECHKLSLDWPLIHTNQTRICIHLFVDRKNRIDFFQINIKSKLKYLFYYKIRNQRKT